MNGLDYLADTNALIYLLSGHSCMAPYLSSHFGVSVISEMELLSFSEISTEEEQVIREYLRICQIISLSPSITEKTITIRRKYKVKLPDAIIVATAIDYGLPLITADKGFSKIEPLKVEILTL